MGKMVSISIEDEGSFSAYRGDTLLDAALMNGIDMPHDCRSGMCGTCRVRVVAGAVDGGETGEHDSILACQAKVRTNLKLAIDPLPEIETLTGKVKFINWLSNDVLEVAITPSRPLNYLPGQYCHFRFSGFPPRSFSPTLPLEGPIQRDCIFLQIRRVPAGQVSAALGRTIKMGHKVKIIGPFGSAHLRAGTSNRLVLIAGGTGFAPIWSIAHGALCDMPDRPIVVIAGARTRQSLYMGPALLRLATFPKVRVVPVLASAPPGGTVFPVGTPVDFMPALSSSDLVFAAGAPAMVKVISNIARDAGAPCFADPFIASTAEESFISRARKWLAPMRSLGQKLEPMAKTRPLRASVRSIRSPQH
jgi:NAD(P)H-flavin reductase/ferredoxin